MGIFGTLLPYIGRVVGPCDANGVPAMSDEEAAASHFESKALVLAWLGLCTMIAYGDVMPRMVDPLNPRRYAPGNL